MAKEPTLRDLGRMIPTRDEFSQIDDEAATGTDRHSALLFGIEIENTIRYCIAAVLAHKDKDTLDKLVDRDGPLATFHQKIDLGYALGLYDKQTQTDMHTIRKIRNSFAHTLKPIDFETPQVAKEIMKLKSGQQHNPPDTTNRDRFGYACKAIAIGLLHTLRDRGGSQALIG